MIVAIDIPDIDKLPRSCRECPLACWGEWHDHCAVDDKTVTEHIISETKPDWCSMRDIGELIHDLYASDAYEDEEWAELYYKSEVEALGIDVSDVRP